MLWQYVAAILQSELQIKVQRVAYVSCAVCTTNMPGYALPQENSGFRTQNVFFICKNGKKAVSLRRRKYDCVY